MTDRHADAPVRLETERLVLDGHRPNDLDALAALWSDPALLALLGLAPATRQESWMRMLRYRGLWPLLGYGYWALRERDTGRYIGDLGFADFHRDIEPSISGVPEVGWALSAWARNRGYAGEALGAAMRWLETQPGVPRCVCLIDPSNIASVRLARRHGFREAAQPMFNDRPTLLMSRPMPAESSGGTIGDVTGKGW